MLLHRVGGHQGWAPVATGQQSLQDNIRAVEKVRRMERVGNEFARKEGRVSRKEGMASRKEGGCQGKKEGRASRKEGRVSRKEGRVSRKEGRASRKGRKEGRHQGRKEGHQERKGGCQPVWAVPAVNVVTTVGAIRARVIVPVEAAGLCGHPAVFEVIFDVTGRLAIRIVVEVPRLLTDGNLSRPGCQIGSNGGPRQKFSSSLNRPLVNVRRFPTFAKPAQSRTFHGYSEVPRLSRGTSNRVGPFFSQHSEVPNFCYLVLVL